MSINNLYPPRLSKDILAIVPGSNENSIVVHGHHATEAWLAPTAHLTASLYNDNLRYDLILEQSKQQPNDTMLDQNRDRNQYKAPLIFKLDDEWYMFLPTISASNTQTTWLRVDRILDTRRYYYDPSQFTVHEMLHPDAEKQRQIISERREQEYVEGTLVEFDNGHMIVVPVQRFALGARLWQASCMLRKRQRSKAFFLNYKRQEQLQRVRQKK